MSDELFTLVDAETARSAAESAAGLSEERQVAYAINYASQKCMQTSCIYQAHLSDEMLAKLKSKKYEVTPLDDATALSKDDNKVYKIDFSGR